MKLAELVTTVLLMGTAVYLVMRKNPKRTLEEAHSAMVADYLYAIILLICVLILK